MKTNKIKIKIHVSLNIKTKMGMKTENIKKTNNNDF